MRAFPLGEELDLLRESVRAFAEKDAGYDGVFFVYRF